MLADGSLLAVHAERIVYSKETRRLYAEAEEVAYAIKGSAAVQLEPGATGAPTTSSSMAPRFAPFDVAFQASVTWFPLRHFDAKTLRYIRTFSSRR